MALVTVSEVIRFALPTGSVVLAGTEGLTNTVNWARTLRARPPTLGTVEQGEVWLLSAGAVQQVGDPRAVARLIREVADAGVVAFFVNEMLPRDALAEADRVNFPIVQLPPDTLLQEAEKAIIGFVVDRDRTIAQRVQEVYDSLLATLVEDRGPELLASIVHAETGKAIYLLDEHFQPTVQTGGTEVTAEGLAEIRRRFWEGQLGNVTGRLITLRTGADQPRRNLAAMMRPLTLRGAVEGYLALLGDRDEFGDFDTLIVDRTASVLAIELAKQSAFVEARLRVQGDFLGELLDKPGVPTEQLASRARALGYDLSQPYLVLVMRLGVPDGTPISPRQQQRFVDLARRRLLGTNVATLLRERDSQVQILLPAPSELADADVDETVRWADQLRCELEQSLAPETMPVIAGIGRRPGGAITYSGALREAIQAADIASTLPNGSRTLHFARLGALRLIFHLTGNPELEAFQRDLLGPIEGYDRTGRSEFVQTLDAFFKAGGNHMRAARDLHVHRNTLIYRLERIQELLGGANLEDPDTRLNLQLALKIRSAIGAQV